MDKTIINPMRKHYARLDENKKVVPVDSLMQLTDYFGEGRDDLRRVAKTEISKDVSVSTVFLAINHGFGYEGKDLWFETMIFGGPHSEYCERYETWDEAVKGHAQAVELAKTEPPKIDPMATPKTLEEAVVQAFSTSIPLCDLHENARNVMKDYMAQKFTVAFIKAEASIPAAVPLLEELYSKLTGVPAEISHSKKD